jgi:alkylation response protein AidB-like acyl-CoA dehydrogenase
VREFVEKEAKPHIDEWNERHHKQGWEIPKEFWRKAYDAGVFAPQWPVELGGTPPEGGFDMFHDLILIDELSRIGDGGIIAGFFVYTMALPPILKVGSPAVIAKVAKDVITARKFLSLCITEPTAGSDVAQMKATAELKGDHYVLNGTKKWITMGIHADWFTVAARTSLDGKGGITLFLVDAKSPGVSVRRMNLQGQWLAGTAFVTFQDVSVPAENVVGKVNQGFPALMTNFNHERLVITAQGNRMARLCIEEAINYARARKTFGARLIDHQVIRHKIADMVRHVENNHAMIEQLVDQMNSGAGEKEIGGSTALLKVSCSKTVELCAREASQILGGASYTREGKGAVVERIYREVRSYAIPGGSEEIMMDLAMRQAKL